MARFRLTKRFDFEMAHALLGYDGLCKNIHGHSYKLDVTIMGEPCQDIQSPKLGMVMDFGDLKRIVQKEITDQVNHALVLNNQTNADLIAVLKQNYERIVAVPYQPTTENLLTDFVQRIQSQLPAHVSLFSLRLYESENSYAEWFASDNQ